MKCSFCNDDFEEKVIQESHDIPCYLFWELPTRKERKQKADKYGRRWLCKKCHDDYEKYLKDFLILTSISFSNKYFGVKNG